jgi:thiol-disulfide isomerase/thioredoxin
MKNKNYWIAGVIVLLAVVFGAIVSYNAYQGESSAFAPGALDGFAQCLKTSGTVFYGAFWCPHCQATKRMFGTSASKLPYVECSTPDESGQTQACIDKGIQEYPTWVFPDGSRLSGEQTLPVLSEKSGCPLPGGIAASSTPVSGAASSAK